MAMLPMLTRARYFGQWMQVVLFCFRMKKYYFVPEFVVGQSLERSSGWKHRMCSPF